MINSKDLFINYSLREGSIIFIQTSEDFKLSLYNISIDPQILYTQIH